MRNKRKEASWGQRKRKEGRKEGMNWLVVRVRREKAGTR